MLPHPPDLGGQVHRIAWAREHPDLSVLDNLARRPNPGSTNRRSTDKGLGNDNRKILKTL